MNTITIDRRSPKIQSLIGIIPQFSQEEIEGDERLKHILNHLLLIFMIV